MPEHRPRLPEPVPGRRRFVLVTGMPRSGTTGVGAALAHAPRSHSYYEPLNPESGLLSVRDYFVLPEPSGTDAVLQRQLDQVFGIDLRIRRGVWPDDPVWKKLVKNVTGSTTRASALRIRLDPRIRTVIWKDPFAAFLVPLLSARHGIGSVVTVRPPEAAAASFQRLGWHFDLDRVHAGLSRLTPGADYLHQEPEWSQWTQRPPLIGALLWRLVYGYLDTVLPPIGAEQPAPGHGPVLWANSHRLLATPLATYEHFYDALDLDFTPEARQAISRDYRDQGGAEPSSRKTHDRSRNVTQANSYWHRILDPADLDSVRRVTDGTRARLEQRVGALS